MSLELRRLLTRALAFLSEHRRQRYWNAASKSAPSSASLHFSFDLLTRCRSLMQVPPRAKLSVSGDTATLALMFMGSCTHKLWDVTEGSGAIVVPDRDVKEDRLRSRLRARRLLERPTD